MNPFLPPWCLSGCPASLVPPRLSQLVLSCLAGASQAFRWNLYCHPWRPPKTGIRSAILCYESPWCLPSCPNDSFLPSRCLPGASSAVQLILACLPGVSLVPPRLSKWLFPTPLVPPWRLASCPMPPWRLPVKSKPVVRAVCATGSQPWSPPQDLPRIGPIAIEIVLKVKQNPAPFQRPGFDRHSCTPSLPRASQAVQMVLSCLPGASLVPCRLSN